MRLPTTIGALSLLALSPFLAAAAASPQTGPEMSGVARSGAARTFADLRRDVPQVTASIALQIRVRWLTAEPVADPTRTDSRFEVLSQERVRASVRTERSPQVSSTSLIIVSHDGSGRELDWRIVADPRLVRSEGGTGTVLTGEHLYYLDAHLRLVIPDLPGLTRLSIYRVRSQGAATLLDIVGSIELPPAK